MLKKKELPRQHSNQTLARGVNSGVLSNNSNWMKLPCVLNACGCKIQVSVLSEFYHDKKQTLAGYSFRETPTQ